MRTVVVVQGPTEPEYVQYIKNGWKGVPILFSTWKEDDTSCYSSSDCVILNEKPLDRGPSNLRLQRVSSLNGFLKAKELGYQRVLKWRSDLVPRNAHSLMNLFQKDCVNFYAFHLQDDVKYGGYLVDYFIEGEIDKMIDLFNSNETTEIPEEALTRRLLERGWKANFVFDKLQEANTDIFWLKKHMWLSKTLGVYRWSNSTMIRDFSTQHLV